MAGGFILVVVFLDVVRQCGEVSAGDGDMWYGCMCVCTAGVIICVVFIAVGEKRVYILALL